MAHHDGIPIRLNKNCSIKSITFFLKDQEMNDISFTGDHPYMMRVMIGNKPCPQKYDEPVMVADTPNDIDKEVFNAGIDGFPNTINYIYLLQEREFIKTSEYIYKIGMTHRKNFERFNQYPKGSMLLMQIVCDNCNDSERKIMSAFKNKFTQRKDIGTEYFEGESELMIDIIYDIVRNKRIIEQAVDNSKSAEITQQPVKNMSPVCIYIKTMNDEVGKTYSKYCDI